MASYENRYDPRNKLLREQNLRKEYRRTAGAPGYIIFIILFLVIAFVAGTYYFTIHRLSLIGNQELYEASVDTNRSYLQIAKTSVDQQYDDAGFYIYDMSDGSIFESPGAALSITMTQATVDLETNLYKKIAVHIGEDGTMVTCPYIDQNNNIVDDRFG